MMHRNTCAVALTCAFALQPAPSSAQHNVETDYEQAVQIFSGGNADTFRLDYRKSLFEGLEGRYYLTLQGSVTPAQSMLIPRMCDRNVVEVKVLDPYRFSLTAHLPRSGEIETIYSSRSGSRFGSYTSPADLLQALGTDGTEYEDIAIGSTAAYNGTVDVWRVGPDILVINWEGTPTIYARCPAQPQ